MMRLRITAIALVSLLATSRADGERAAGPKYSQADLLKNYALARCLGQAFPDTPLACDAAASAGGYLEQGRVSADAYASIAKFAGDFLARTYPSQAGEPLQTMKCIDLFHSADLERVVRNYASKR